MQVLLSLCFEINYSNFQLKNELADKPRDYRLAIAEKVSSAVLKRLLQDEEDEEKKEE